MFKATDFCLGKNVNLSWLIVDATNLGVGKNVVSFNEVVSNPWSMKDTSVPFALVPDMVLTVVLSWVVVPGVIKLICGENVLYWWFCDILASLEPNAFSSLKHSNEFPVLWFNGSKADLSTSR